MSDLFKNIVAKRREYHKVQEAEYTVTLDDVMERVKKLESKILDYFMEELNEQVGGQEIGEALFNDGVNIPGQKHTWTLYGDGGEDHLVFDVKNEGYPDMDEIFQKASKKLKLPLENVSEFRDDVEWGEFINSEVELIVDFMKQDFPDFVVLGRSGGHWGTSLGKFHLEVKDHNSVRKIIKDILYSKDFEHYLYELLKGGVNTYIYLQDDRDDYFIGTIVDGLLKDDDKYERRVREDFVGLDRESLDYLKRLGNEIESSVKENESTDKWVGMIVQNSWYNPAIEKVQESDLTTKARKIWSEDI